jgi:hypothetical protein
MKVLKLEQTYLNLSKVRSYRIEDNGDVLVIYRKKEAYRFSGKKAELLKKWLLHNHQEP